MEGSSSHQHPESNRNKPPRLARSHSATPKILYVVVVESHQHVLEHIHTVLRKHKLLTKNWSMIHFDSHPDLACPNPSIIPAIACFLPHQEFFPLSDTSSSSSRSSDPNYYFGRKDDGTNNNIDGSDTMIDITGSDNNDPSNGGNAIMTNDTDNNTVANQEKKTKKKNLYEMLDSTASGIAEWILPLVLAANLRRVHWIKSIPSKQTNSNISPPSQLPLGRHSFHVGATISSSIQIKSFLDLPDSAVVKVDWPHPYYLEDNCTVGYGSGDKIGGDGEQLVLQQPLELIVSALPPTCNSETENLTTTHNSIASAKDTNHGMFDSTNGSMNGSSQSPPAPTAAKANITDKSLWELDICLDYFACQNPFLTDLQAKDAGFANTLCNAVFQSKFYATDIMSQSTSAADISAAQQTILQTYRRDLHQFWKQLAELLRHHVDMEPSDTSSSTDLSHIYADLESCYTDACQGRRCLQDLVEAFRATSIDDQPLLLAMTQQALPNLMMPHHTPTASSSSSAFTMDDIRPSLHRVLEELQQHYDGTDEVAEDGRGNIKAQSFPVETGGTRPFMITIARSSNDGFTPASVVEQLQTELLQGLHDLYCGCSRPTPKVWADKDDKKHEHCLLEVVFDYGQWEGSTIT